MTSLLDGKVWIAVERVCLTPPEYTAQFALS